MAHKENLLEMVKNHTPISIGFIAAGNETSDFLSFVKYFSAKFTFCSSLLLSLMVLISRRLCRIVSNMLLHILTNKNSLSLSTAEIISVMHKYIANFSPKFSVWILNDTPHNLVLIYERSFTRLPHSRHDNCADEYYNNRCAVAEFQFLTKVRKIREPQAQNEKCPERA